MISKELIKSMELLVRGIAKKTGNSIEVIAAREIVEELDRLSQTKICGKCNHERSINDFWKTKTTKDGLAYYCKYCKLEYAKQRLADEMMEEDLVPKTTYRRITGKVMERKR